MKSCTSFFCTHFPLTPWGKLFTSTFTWQLQIGRGAFFCSLQYFSFHIINYCDSMSTLEALYQIYWCQQSRIVKIKNNQLQPHSEKVRNLLYTYFKFIWYVRCVSKEINTWSLQTNNNCVSFLLRRNELSCLVDIGFEFLCRNEAFAPLSWLMGEWNLFI